MLRTATVIVILMVAPTGALAWDGPGSWYEVADGMSPGGGGIFGTGAARDHRITCLDCHVQRADGDIDARFTFSPALASAGGFDAYQPGQTYQVDVALLGEFLTGPCDQYMAHTNNFAATFEGVATDGAVGVLESDSGQTQTSCPTDYPDPATGTTVLYRDCDVIFSNGDEDITQWRFFWTAPAAGTGEIVMYYGAVDGDCAMNSMGDAVVSDRLVMVEASASSERRASSRWRYAALVLLPLLVVTGLRKRRREL